MIKKILSLTFLFFLITINNFVMANNIFFVDMDKILSTSKPGSLIIKKLNELDKKNVKDFNDIEKRIKDNETKLLSKKNILSKEEYNKGVDELRLEIKNYRENKKKIVQTFNNLKIKDTKKLLKSINPILSKYSKENSVSVIMDKKNIIVAKNELDITKTILKILDAKIKNIKLN
jgi:outer membrane protein